jgi:hypothetical protein
MNANNLRVTSNVMPHFSLPFIYKERGGFSPGVEQIEKNRENRCPQNRGRNYFLFGNYLREALERFCKVFCKDPSKFVTFSTNPSCEEGQ